jgi:hypothetical protein
MSNLQKASSECSNLETSKSKVQKSFELPKIYTLENDEQIKTMLKYVFTMVGLQNIPSKEEFFVLVNYVKSNYSVYSVEEIRIAFELAISKQIVAETNHYGIFSCTYFSNIMGAYSDYRERIAKEYLANQEREQNKPKEPTKEQIKALKKDFFNQVLLPLFEKYKANKKLEFGLTPIRIVYESLRDDHKVIDLTLEEKGLITSEYSDVKEVQNEGLNKFIGAKQTPQEKRMNYCQKRAIEISFDKKINKNETLKFEL